MVQRSSMSIVLLAVYSCKPTQPWLLLNPPSIAASVGRKQTDVISESGSAVAHDMPWSANHAIECYGRIILCSKISTITSANTAATHDTCFPLWMSTSWDRPEIGESMARPVDGACNSATAGINGMGLQALRSACASLAITSYGETMWNWSGSLATFSMARPIIDIYKRNCTKQELQSASRHTSVSLWNSFAVRPYFKLESIACNVTYLVPTETTNELGLLIFDIV